MAAISAFWAENQEIIGFRCLAHSIELTINDLSQISPFKEDFLGIIPNFVRHFNKPDNNNFKIFKVLSGKPENQCLKPIKPNATRWSSTYHCVCRIIDLKNFLPLVGLVFLEDEWERIYFSKTLLKTFKECNDFIQKDSATIVDGVELWQELENHVDNIRNLSSGMCKNFFKKARDIIIRRTTKHMSMTPHLEVVNFLNPRNKTDYDNLISITDELRSMAQYYFQELGIEGISVCNKIAKVNIQMAAYVLGGCLWELESEKETVVHYWTRQVFRAPELARVELFYCTTHPTEACVERTFSHQGLICNDLRSSLSEKSVKALMKVRFNYLSLSTEPQDADVDEITY